jgi:hypothetical protein
MHASTTIVVRNRHTFPGIGHCIIACVWAFGAWAGAAKAQDPARSIPQLQRLSEAARLWGRVQWAQPALAHGSVDWDRALLEALPALAAADSDEAERQALLKLLQPLNDPAVRIGPKVEPRYVKAGEKVPLIEWLPGQVALLNLQRPIASWDATFEASVKTAGDAIERAEAVVADLRPAAESFAEPADLLDRLLPAMVTTPTQLPSQRIRFHHGYPPQTGSTSGGYYSAWVVQASRFITPGTKPRVVPMVFIVNEWTVIPLAVLALHRAGLAYIVAEGQPNLSWVVPTEEMRLHASLLVRFSAGQLVFPDGSSGFGADQVLANDAGTGPGSRAVQAAQRVLASKAKPGESVSWQSLPALPIWTADRRYSESAFPNLPLRQLAVIRLWSVIDAFFPYKDLLDQPWADVLPEFLGRVGRAKDDREYFLAMAEMAARLQDNHTRVSGGAAAKSLGEAALPVRMGMVEGKVVVTEVLDIAAANGLAQWDEVLEVDGEPADRAIGRLSAYLAFANAWTRDRNVLRRAFGRGADGSHADLKIRGAASATRNVTLVRSIRYASLYRLRRVGSEIRVLPGNIGYVDLDRLAVEQVD